MSLHPTKMICMFIPALTMFLTCSTAWAEIVITKPWSRATIGKARPGVVYMKIANKSDTQITLSGLKTDIASRVAIHQTKVNDEGVSSMKPAGSIIIKPKSEIILEPRGFHGMLKNLQVPLKEGDKYTLILLFSDGSEMAIEVPILSIGARGPDN